MLYLVVFVCNLVIALFVRCLSFMFVVCFDGVVLVDCHVCRICGLRGVMLC